MKLHKIKILVDFFGQELIELIQRWRTYRRKYKSGRFSRFGIDKILEDLLPHRNGFYVELGAYDGALASNSYFFELKKNWKGILIEPSLNLYLSCLKRREKNNSIFCNACVPFDYEDEFVRMKYSDSATISDNLDLDIGNHNEFVAQGDKKKIKGESSFVFGAKSATLNSILLAAAAPSLIDFLSLDVEGAELDVLKGIDFDKFKFKYMIIECRAIGRLEDFLSNHEYRLVKKVTHHDYLFALEMSTQ